MRFPQIASWLLVSLLAPLVFLAPEANSQTRIVNNSGNSGSTHSFTASPPTSNLVSLAWDASISPDVVGYNVYRGKISGGPYRKINHQLDPNTGYTDRRCYSGHTYYYVTTAVDSSGNESTYSNQATAVIP